MIDGNGITHLPITWLKRRLIKGCQSPCHANLLVFLHHSKSEGTGWSLPAKWYKWCRVWYGRYYPERNPLGRHWNYHFLTMPITQVGEKVTESQVDSCRSFTKVLLGSPSVLNESWFHAWVEECRLASFRNWCEVIVACGFESHLGHKQYDRNRVGDSHPKSFRESSIILVNN